MDAADAVQTNGLGSGVRLGQIAIDCCLQIDERAKCAAADALAGQHGEEVLHRVQPILYEPSSMAETVIIDVFRRGKGTLLAG